MCHGGNFLRSYWFSIILNWKASCSPRILPSPINFGPLRTLIWVLPPPSFPAQTLKIFMSSCQLRGDDDMNGSINWCRWLQFNMSNKSYLYKPMKLYHNMEPLKALIVSTTGAYFQFCLNCLQKFEDKKDKKAKYKIK